MLTLPLIAVYQASDAPRYKKGNSILLGITALNLIVICECGRPRRDRRTELTAGLYKQILEWASTTNGAMRKRRRNGTLFRRKASANVSLLLALGA